VSGNKRNMINLGMVILLLAALPPDLYPGTIKGKVLTKKDIPHRVAQRYPGRHPQATGVVEPIPAVVMILGPVKGYPPSPPAEAQKIVQKGLKFHPPLLVIPVNTSVAFPNQDLEFHNVFSYSKTKRFDLGRYHKGESKSVHFTKPGVCKIYCEIHQWMRAVVAVTENPFYATADEDGRFEIKNVPQGTYRLLIWKIDYKQAIQKITVPDGGTIEITVSLPEEKSGKSKDDES
jgi:plastocyanin